jgi:hypothetical protein
MTHLHLQESVSRCQRSIADTAALTALCSSASSYLSPSAYLGPSYLPEPTATVAVPFTRGTVQQRSSTDGTLTAVTGAVPAATFDAVANVCKNAVWQVLYTLVYTLQADSSRGSISAVVVDLVLGDVPAAASGPLAFKQAFSASWRNSSAANVAPLPVSGNPGYITRYPLLVRSCAAAACGQGWRPQAAIAARCMAPAVRHTIADVMQHIQTAACMHVKGTPGRSEAYALDTRRGLWRKPNDFQALQVEPSLQACL